MLLFFITGALLVTLHAYYYYLFVADDSFISFRYVSRLLEGKGLTWTDGQPVEGYSNLLWILLLAAIKKIVNAELWVIALAVNYVCSIASLWFLLKLVAKLTGYDRTALFWSCALFVLSAPVAIWINGGLEAPLIMLLLMLALNYIPFSGLGVNKVLPAGLFLGLIALTRPDGILFCWAISLAVFCMEYMLTPSEDVQSRFKKTFSAVFGPLLLLNIIVIVFYTAQLRSEEHTLNSSHESVSRMPSSA